MQQENLPRHLTGSVCFKFGDDINTDYIIPAHLLQEAWEKKFFAAHAFEKYDSSFVNECKKSSSNIVVAGKNFGCGSSREQAVYAIQYNNVRAIIAESFPDIFYRNCLNNGFPALVVEDTSRIQVGDVLEISLGDLIIKKEHPISPEMKILMSGEDRDSLVYGGRLNVVKTRYSARLAS